MSANKKNRSLWGSRSEAQRIYYQRQTIKRLEQENNQLKEQRQELRSWLEEETKKGGSSIDLAIRIHTIQEVLNRLEGKND